MREIIRDPRHDRTRGLGFLALAWIEHFCVHGPGDVQGTPLDPTIPGSLPLDDEFAGFILDAYALTDLGGRLYTSAFISRAKGRAKSELAAFIALFEALGPCRAVRDEDGIPLLAEGGETYTMGDFVYTYEAGEPMGRQISYPFIRCLATEEQQAGNTYDNIYLNLDIDVNPRMRAFGFSKNDVGITRINIPGGGEIRPSSASSAAKDGGKETFVVFDESHLYITPELRRMYGTVTRNLDKRKIAEPWSLETSTMYAPGQDSIAEETHKTARLIHEGKALTEGIFFDHRQAAPDTDVTSRASIIEGLREAYGPASEWMDLERICNSFFDIRKPIADQRRYFLNQPTSASDAWLVSTEWDSCADKKMVMSRKDAITLGFDGSEKSSNPNRPADATALIACRISDGALFTLGVWEQPPGPEGVGWSVPVQEVMDLVEDTFDRYEVVAFFADPAKWEGVVTDWEQKYGPRLRVKAGAKNAIAWWMNRTIMVGRALDRFENTVRDRELLHDGSEVLTRHALNARRKPRGNAMGIGKEHPSSRNKIDAVVAAVLAFEARAVVISQAPARKRTFKVASVIPS